MGNQWIFRGLRSEGAPFRLYCFPYAGGSASLFRDWSTAFGPNIDVVAIEIPGHGARRREKPFTSVEALVNAAYLALREEFNHPPYVVFGHSMGALIGFELLRLLRREGRKLPLHFFVSGARAPHIRHHEPPIHGLLHAEFVDELERLDGTPQDILRDKKLMEFLSPMIRADFKIVETYSHRPENPLSCPISAFGGLEDARVTREALTGWRKHTTSSFNAHFFPGGHFFIHAEANAIIHLIMQKIYECVQSGRDPETAPQIS